MRLREGLTLFVSTKIGGDEARPRFIGCCLFFFSTAWNPLAIIRFQKVNAPARRCVGQNSFRKTALSAEGVMSEPTIIFLLATGMMLAAAKIRRQ